MAFLPIFDALSPVITKVLDFIPDPTQKLQAQQQLMSGLMQWDSQQNAINTAEAANSSIFVSGARPFILWVCGASFAYKFVLQPFLAFIIIACGIQFNVKLLPSLDWTEMSTVMFGMLGLGGMRTYEKMQGLK